MSRTSALATVQSPADLQRRFECIRSFSLALAAPLSDADASMQSMPDASPTKWHLAHTTWFFESFVLCEFVQGYNPFNRRFPELFNSYYDVKGARIERSVRGLLTRPSLAEIQLYREHVDVHLTHSLRNLPPVAQELIELGCQHEEQHQELILTDLLHLFALNPLQPAVWPAVSTRHSPVARSARDSVGWIEGRRGSVEIGHAGSGFSFDSERPRHVSWLAPHALADRLVTNAEWLDFMEEGGYGRSELWLAEGWAWARENWIEAPMYWRRDKKNALSWSLQFGLGGTERLDPGAPVAHVSYYEADAFARWWGARLPTEVEWESAAATGFGGCAPPDANLLDRAGAVGPQPAPNRSGLRQLFGDVWEWTASAFLPYPGFRPASGAVGEHSEKFMSGQYVLKGGSCATPRDHIRGSYRHFFYPHQRWQFTGVRLAKDL